MDDIKMIIAFNLQYFRKKKKLTQTEVSNRMNMVKGTLSKYESGLREPSFTTLQKLAELYGCEIVDFFGGQRSETIKLEPKIERIGQELQSLPESKKESLLRIIDFLIAEARKE